MSDRLLVKSEYLALCGWCGTHHSPKWVGTKKGKMYCSGECQKAATSQRMLWTGFCITASGGFMLLFPFTFELFSVGFYLLIGGIPLLVEGIQGREYMDRQDKYRNTHPLLCEYCSHINSPDVVVCNKCGASLGRAEFTLDTWPEWFKSPSRGQVRKCPHCHAIYSYIIESDGSSTLICQNCARPF